MSFDLSSLSSDERNMLLQALQSGGGDTDQGGDDDSMYVTKDAFNAVCEKLDYLEKVVMDQLINPIMGLYDAQERDFGVKSLGDKYGEKFGGYKDAYSKLVPNSDLFDRLFDEIKSRKSSTPDWSDEHEATTVEEIYSKLKDLVDSIKGVDGSASIEIEAQPVAQEEVKEEAPPVDDLMEKVKAMKARKNPSSLQ